MRSSLQHFEASFCPLCWCLSYGLVSRLPGQVEGMLHFAGVTAAKPPPIAVYFCAGLALGRYLFSEVSVIAPCTLALLALGSQQPSEAVSEPLLDARVVQAKQATGVGVQEIDGAKLMELSRGKGPLAWEAVVQQLPGTVTDEDGRLHVRGESGDGQILLDGIPLLGTRQRVLSPLPDPRLLGGVEVRQNLLSSDLPSGGPVFSATTRAATNQPTSMMVGADYGSWNTMAWHASAGASPVKGWGVLVGASGAGSDRFLDPVMSSRARHVDGNNLSTLGKIEHLGGSWGAELLGWNGLTDYSIARHELSTRPEDQQSHLRDGGAGIRAYSLGLTGFRWDATAWYQGADGRVRSGGRNDLFDAADYRFGIAENDRMFVGADRRLRAMGGSLSLGFDHSLLGRPATFRAGVDGDRDEVREFLSMAVTDSSIAKDSTGGDDRLAPYDLTRGGHPLRIRASRDIYASGAWFDEAWQTGSLAWHAGARLVRLDPA